MKNKIMSAYIPLVVGFFWLKFYLHIPNKLQELIFT